MKKIVPPFLLLWLLLVICACADPSGRDEPPAAPYPFCTDAALTVEKLDTRTVTREGQDYEYWLLRLQGPGYEPSYAQFFPPPSGTASPCILQTMPYDFIDWTGEEEDVTACAAHGGSTTPDSMVEQAYLHLHNGFGALFVYGRFYRGGSIVNDVNDMLWGLKFLEQESLALNDRIGVTGASWGGFEGLYACAYAPEAVRPVAASILYPVSDFSLWYSYAGFPESYIISDGVRTVYEVFFSPYLERISAATGGAPTEGGSDYSYFTGDELAGRLRTGTLIIHDGWDTLVPMGGTVNLAAACGSYIHPFYLLHDSPIDYETFGLSHGELQGGGSSSPAYFTWQLLYLYKALAGETRNILVFYDPERLRSFCAYVREYADKGFDMDWAAERFLDFFDQRIQLYNITDVTLDDSAEVITSEINLAWGGTWTEGELKTLLSAGLPQ